MIQKLRTSLLFPAELAETAHAYVASIQELTPDEPLTNKITTMQQLNLNMVYEELKQAQADFEMVYDRHINEEVDLYYPTLKRTRKRIIPHINSLLNVIQVLEETEPDKYRPLTDKLNTITKQIMSAARSRKTRVMDEAEQVMARSL